MIVLEICVAGAGAGKTTKMADNIIRLRRKIDESKMIYCVTFTNNAVLCIESKLKEYYGILPNNIIVSTIHSFLYRELIKPYYYLLYGKHYQKISVARLPDDVKYRNAKIKRLDEQNILHQTVIPERAKWVIHQKASDTKTIKNKRNIIIQKFESYCGAICVDEAQDIDRDMQIIIEGFGEQNIKVVLMGDPKQDLRGHNCFRNLIEKYKDSVTYIEDCFRCPIKHLKLSNLLVEDSQKQHSSKEHGVVTVWFESEKTCADLLKEYEFDLSYISKKQGMYDTHIKENNTDITLSLSDEIAPILRRNHTSLEDIILKKTAYYFAGKIITSYRENRDRVLAIKQFTNYEKISRKDYGILINAIPENRIEEVRDTIVVSSIDSIKGKEGKNCLFILTTDLAAYLFAKKTSDNATKNRLYVALTRSLESLTIFITVEVEIQYGKTNIIDFFAKNLTVQ